MHERESVLLRFHQWMAWITESHGHHTVWAQVFVSFFVFLSFFLFLLHSYGSSFFLFFRTDSFQCCSYVRACVYVFGTLCVLGVRMWVHVRVYGLCGVQHWLADWLAGCDCRHILCGISDILTNFCWRKLKNEAKRNDNSFIKPLDNVRSDSVHCDRSDWTAVFANDFPLKKIFISKTETINKQNIE